MTKIVRVEAFGVGLPLRKPMRLASEIIEVAENLFVRITASDGAVGWGEAASAPSMTGDLLTGMVDAVRRFIAPALHHAALDDLGSLEKTIRRSLRANAGAKSAVCMALYDLIGRQRGVPMHALLGPVHRLDVPALCMLGSGDAKQDAATASAAADAGFRHFKVKVGRSNPCEDARSVAAVRAAVGPDVELTADANMAWTVAQGLTFLRAVQSLSLGYLEQPLADDDLEGVLMLTRAGLGAIAADEGIHGVEDVGANAAVGVRWFGLKLIKLGGYSSMCRAIERCASVGGWPILASKIAESSVAASALAHLAVTLPEIRTGVSFTHGYLQSDVTKTPLPILHGSVRAPGCHGHGVLVDEAAIRAFRIDQNWRA